MIERGEGSSWRRLLERWHRLWAALQAENIPRLGAFFLTVLMAGGLATYFIERGSNEQFKSPEDGLWWSLVTLTTIGYGDKYPISTPGRLIAFVVVLLGIGLVGTVTAKIASALVERRIKEGKGLTEAYDRKGHLVLLGWKPDLHLLLERMLHIAPDLLGRGIVVVNQAGEISNEELRRRFPGLVYIHGDTIDPQVLHRARVKEAAKVLVLADEAIERSDQEKDARTVMIVMNIERSSPDVYTCAEILDPKSVEYLQIARCDEIVLLREYGRQLLVGASLSNGLSQVLNSLLDFGDSESLSTTSIPSEFVGRPFSELAAHFRTTGGRLLIGLLENSGQSVAIKREALRAAQKADRVATLIENLEAVKTLVNNQPVLNPPQDYMVRPHAAAIVIGRTVPAGTA